MNKPTNTQTMIVRLVDGSVQRFRFPPGGDDVQLATRINEWLKGRGDLLLDVGDRLLVIPEHSILTIEMSPAPAKLPPIAIRNAQVIE
jgi:hypothetical protein